MILNSKQTTVAYRCPHCGTGVMSAVGLFALSADMVKLKCTCGRSEMTLVHGKDGKVRLTVPCLVCPNPHPFTLNDSLFFEKDLFTLSCPYSDLMIACMGDVNLVKGELARSELELLDLMEQSGITGFEAMHENEAEELTDPQVREIVLFVIKELDEEGHIHCHCPEDATDKHYDVDILPEGIRVTCTACGAMRMIPTDSNLSAHAFLTADALYLE